MASKFEQGQSIYFLFHNGQTATDSQLKPRYYTTKDKAKKYSLDGYYDVVEYAPVRYRQWLDGRCTACGWEEPDACGYDGYEIEPCRHTPLCPNCGVRMDGDK